MSLYQLTWKPVKFLKENEKLNDGQSELHLKINYTYPLEISTNIIQDSLSVMFLNLTNFTS